MLQNNLARLRVKAGLTQLDMTEALNISQGDYSRAENGRYLLEWQQVEKAAKLFGCAPNVIYPEPVRVYLLGQERKSAPKRQSKSIRLPLVLAEQAEAAAVKHGYNGAADFVAAATREKLEGLGE